MKTFGEYINESRGLFSEYMLEWSIPGKESNTMMTKGQNALKEILKFIEEKSLKLPNYTIKGMLN